MFIILTEIIKKIVVKCKQDNIFAIANQLTYKTLLSFFPFIIFLINLIAYFNLDINVLLIELKNKIPDQIISLINMILKQTIEKKNLNLLSWSLVIGIFNASSGFEAMITSLNKISYPLNKKNFLELKIISLSSMFLFALAIISCTVAVVLGNKLSLLLNYKLKSDIFLNASTVFFRYVSISIILIILTTIIYRISNIKKIKLKKILIGSSFCTILWIFSSLAFNFYINNFTQIPIIYGSIAGFFILMLWLNLLFIILIIGFEVSFTI